jgi:proteasome lid subunit RPN8/RPN11
MTATATFVLPTSMRDEIIEHARVEAPLECCGIIATQGGELVELYRMRNIYEGVDFYEVDPMDLYRLYQAFEETGRDVGVIYHSHPVSPPYPSARDIEHAGWIDPVYVICSLQDAKQPELRAYRILDGTVTELEIVTP